MTDIQSTNTETCTDIAILAREALTEATRPEAVKEIVESRINKTVHSAIDSALQSFSPFGRELEKKIQEALSLNNLNLPQYNNIICGMVQEIVQANVSDLVSGRMKSDIEKMLKVAPKEIKLSEIVDEMRQGHEEDGGYGEVVTCFVDRDDPTDRSWGPKWSVYLDDGESLSFSERKSATIQFSMSHGLISQSDEDDPEQIDTGTIYHVYDRSGSISGTGGFRKSKQFGLVNRILALYAAGTIITVDDDDVVTSVGDY